MDLESIRTHFPHFDPLNGQSPEEYLGQGWGPSPEAAKRFGAQIRLRAVVTAPEAFNIDLDPDSPGFRDLDHGATLAWEATVQRGEDEKATFLGPPIAGLNGGPLVPWPIWDNGNVFYLRNIAYAILPEMTPRPGLYLDRYMNPEGTVTEAAILKIGEHGEYGMHAQRVVLTHPPGDHSDDHLQLIHFRRRYASGLVVPVRCRGINAIMRELKSNPVELPRDSATWDRLQEWTDDGRTRDPGRTVVDEEDLAVLVDRVRMARSPEPAESIRALPSQRVSTAIHSLRSTLREVEGETCDLAVDVIDRNQDVATIAREVVAIANGEARVHALENARRKWTSMARAVNLTTDVGTIAYGESEALAQVPNPRAWAAQCNRIRLRVLRASKTRNTSGRIEPEDLVSTPASGGFINRAKADSSGRTPHLSHAASLVRSEIPGGSETERRFFLAPAIALADGRIAELTPDLEYVDENVGYRGGIIDYRARGATPTDTTHHGRSAFSHVGGAHRNQMGDKHRSTAIPVRGGREAKTATTWGGKVSRNCEMHARVALLDGDHRTYEDAAIVSESFAASVKVTTRRTTLLTRRANVEYLSGAKVRENLDTIMEATGIRDEKAFANIHGSEGIAIGSRPLRAGDVLQVGREVTAEDEEGNPTAWKYIVDDRVKKSWKGMVVTGCVRHELTDDDISASITYVLSAEREAPLRDNDKISTPGGAKMMIQVVPDAQMPHDAEGRAFDVSVSTPAISSRTATGDMHAMRYGDARDRVIAEIDEKIGDDERYGDIAPMLAHLVFVDGEDAVRLDNVNEFDRETEGRGAARDLARDPRRGRHRHRGRDRGRGARRDEARPQDRARRVQHRPLPPPVRVRGWTRAPVPGHGSGARAHGRGSERRAPLELDGGPLTARERRDRTGHHRRGLQHHAVGQDGDAHHRRAQQRRCRAQPGRDERHPHDAKRRRGARGGAHPGPRHDPQGGARARGGEQH